MLLYLKNGIHDTISYFILILGSCWNPSVLFENHRHWHKSSIICCRNIFTSKMGGTRTFRKFARGTPVSHVWLVTHMQARTYTLWHYIEANNISKNDSTIKLRMYNRYTSSSWGQTPLTLAKRTSQIIRNCKCKIQMRSETMFSR